MLSAPFFRLENQDSKKKKNQDSEMKNPIPQNPEIAESDF